MNLAHRVPDAQQVLALTHAQLGREILVGLHEQKRGEIRHTFGRVSPTQPAQFHIQDVQYDAYAADVRFEVGLAVKEAWAWMERELILLSSDPLAHGWKQLSRIGASFLADGDPHPLLAARHLDRELLHPSLRVDALDNFLRGSYDVAVFCAFRSIEVAVRTATDLPQTRIGTGLMTDAFNPGDGPLRDPSVPNAEQVALMNLFQGAIGMFKNPNSHRYVEVTPQTAAELLLLASYLLKLVDARSQPR